jgi:hypothetical protein
MGCIHLLLQLFDFQIHDVTLPEASFNFMFNGINLKRRRTAGRGNSRESGKGHSDFQDGHLALVFFKQCHVIYKSRIVGIFSDLAEADQPRDHTAEFALNMPPEK